MANSYDDVKYAGVERLYLGPWMASSTMTADKTMLKRFYFKGPVLIKKFGVRHIATQGGTDSVITLKKNAAVIATVIASTDAAPWTIASKSSLSKRVAQGSYLTITNEGTVATGTVECFVDYMKLYSTTWNA